MDSIMLKATIATSTPRAFHALISGVAGCTRCQIVESSGGASTSPAGAPGSPAPSVGVLTGPPVAPHRGR